MAENKRRESKSANRWWALMLLFVALKLTGHVDWSWWLVLCPWWGFVLLHSLIVSVREEQSKRSDSAEGKA